MFPPYTSVRAAYGCLLLLSLFLLLLHLRRFFSTEKHGGYYEPSPFRDFFHRPFFIFLIFAAWSTAAVCLIYGEHVLPAAAFNLALSYYFFVMGRWKSLSRGLGAPGYFTYWPAAAILLFELTAQLSAERALVMALLRLDFSLIFLSSGFYKFRCGYFKNEGMEYGLANPMWGYWWKFFGKRKTKNFYFKALDQLAWSTQILGGLLILFPQTTALGVLLFAFIFLDISTKIRLGTLCPLVIVSALLLVQPAQPLDWAAAQSPLAAFLKIHLFLLPLCHLALSYNFYFKKDLPVPLQKALNVYSNLFGLIIWRVFTSDLINFYVNIYEEPRGGGKRELLSEYKWKGAPNRFNHVCESITITSLFTTLKYYASNRSLFENRLMRYAKTLSCGRDSRIIFEYVPVRKDGGRFTFHPAAEYRVDISKNEITEKILDPSFDVHASAPHSILHEGRQPGSYAPAKEKR